MPKLPSLTKYIQESQADFEKNREWEEDEPEGEESHRHRLLPFPDNTTVLDTEDYDWYKFGVAASDLDDADPTQFQQGDSDIIVVPFGNKDADRLLPLLKHTGIPVKRLGKEDRPEITKESLVDGYQQVMELLSRRRVQEVNASDELTIDDDLIKRFTDKGWDIWGEGRDQIVLGKPSARQVLKIVGQGSDVRLQTVKKYVEFFRDNQRNPHFPRVGFDKLLRWNNKNYYAYSQEALKHLSGEEAVLDYLENAMNAVARGDNIPTNIPQGLSQGDVDGLVNAVEHIISRFGSDSLDLGNVYNIMQRDNGQLVIVDPLGIFGDEEVTESRFSDMELAIMEGGGSLEEYYASLSEEAAGVGVVANKKQANDPRYVMSLTKDVQPGEVARQAAKFGNKLDKNGLPPKLRESTDDVKAWIKSIYDKYPASPLNPRQRAMVWGEGEDQQFAIFELTPNPARKNAVEVTWFQAYPLRQGVGTRAMQELQAQAKSAGVTLTLYPWDKGQVSQSKLIKFYKQSGFKPTARGAKTMQWTPEGIDIDEWVDYQLQEDASAGATGAGAVAVVSQPIGSIWARDPMAGKRVKRRRKVAEGEVIPAYFNQQQRDAAQDARDREEYLKLDAAHEAKLKRLAAWWWNNDENAAIEKRLDKLGFEIGQDEGYDNGGVFIVAKGDVNGNSYISWPAEELEEINEAFDQPYPVNWEQGDHGDWDALAQLSDGTGLIIMFNNEQDSEGHDSVQVEFHRNNSQEVTGEGDAQRVFATVLAAIEQYIDQHQPDSLTFSATKTTDGVQSQSRANLYDRLVQRYARRMGYRSFRADAGDVVHYELNRISPVEEGWREKAAAAAVGAAAVLGGQQIDRYFDTKMATEPTQQQLAQKPATPKEILEKTAKAAGLTGQEFVQFMAQCAHESLNFTRMIEIGTPQYFMKKYDKKFAPKTARILGNKLPGDGELFKGRGFIQLTGRDNYARAGKALGLDLVNNPDLAAEPNNAARIAVWYWQNRVAPKVDNFHDTRAVTKKINPAGKGMKDRKDKVKQMKLTYDDELAQPPKPQTGKV